ncbi:unnamed protein product [Amoebophrya sp. A25]|nr:unnamed protein product [Amoebophrya sp. A25]|eukprot:GSA25T00013317001.1
MDRYGPVLSSTTTTSVLLDPPLSSSVVEEQDSRIEVREDGSRVLVVNSNPYSSDATALRQRRMERKRMQFATAAGQKKTTKKAKKKSKRRQGLPSDSSSEDEDLNLKLKVTANARPGGRDGHGSNSLFEHFGRTPSINASSAQQGVDLRTLMALPNPASVGGGGGARPITGTGLSSSAPRGRDFRQEALKQGVVRPGMSSLGPGDHALEGPSAALAADEFDLESDDDDGRRQGPHLAPGHVIGGKGGSIGSNTTGDSGAGIVGRHGPSCLPQQHLREERSTIARREKMQRLGVLGPTSATVEQRRQEAVQRFALFSNLPVMLQRPQLEKMAFLVHLIQILFFKVPDLFVAPAELVSLQPSLRDLRVKVKGWKKKQLPDICAYYPEFFVCVDVFHPVPAKDTVVPGPASLSSSGGGSISSRSAATTLIGLSARSRRHMLRTNPWILDLTTEEAEIINSAGTNGLYPGSPVAFSSSSRAAAGAAGAGESSSETAEKTTGEPDIYGDVTTESVGGGAANKQLLSSTGGMLADSNPTLSTMSSSGGATGRGGHQLVAIPRKDVADSRALMKVLVSGLREHCLGDHVDAQTRMKKGKAMLDQGPDPDGSWKDMDDLELFYQYEADIRRLHITYEGVALIPSIDLKILFSTSSSSTSKDHGAIANCSSSSSSGAESMASSPVTGPALAVGTKQNAPINVIVPSGRCKMCPFIRADLHKKIRRVDWLSELQTRAKSHNLPEAHSTVREFQQLAEEEVKRKNDDRCAEIYADATLLALRKGIQETFGKPRLLLLTKLAQVAAAAGNANNRKRYSAELSRLDHCFRDWRKYFRAQMVSDTEAPNLLAVLRDHDALFFHRHGAPTASLTLLGIQLLLKSEKLRINSTDIPIVSASANTVTLAPPPAGGSRSR